MFIELLPYMIIVGLFAWANSLAYILSDCFFDTWKKVSIYIIFNFIVFYSLGVILELNGVL
jgi:hypothetical protein